MKKYFFLLILLGLFAVSAYFYIHTIVEYYYYQMYHCEVCHLAAEKPEKPNPILPIISLCVMISTFIAALSGIILGGIKERREARETRLRIEKLEYELDELRKAKAEESKPKIII